MYVCMYVCIYIYIYIYIYPTQVEAREQGLEMEQYQMDLMPDDSSDIRGLTPNLPTIIIIIIIMIIIMISIIRIITIPS